MIVIVFKGAHVELQQRAAVQQFRVIPCVRRVILGNVGNSTSSNGIPENSKFAHEISQNSRSCTKGQATVNGATKIAKKKYYTYGF